MNDVVDWMETLARHYARARTDHPGAPLLVVFDIDGTILDLRHLVVYVLQAYDRVHGTKLFRGLDVDAVDVDESEVETLLLRRGLDGAELAAVHRWYLRHRWSSAAIQHAHRPFRGVLEVIRWFQLQPHTFVGLNTARPEALRLDTLRSLNRLGEGCRVRFRDALLQMGAEEGSGESIPERKVAALRRFREQGYRVVAMVDNEPGNLAAVSASGEGAGVLLLHAATTFQRDGRRAPDGIACGDRYGLGALIGTRDLPERVRLVRCEVHDRDHLERFLASTVGWAALDVRSAPFTDEPVLRRHSFARRPFDDVEEIVLLREVLPALERGGRCVRFDLADTRVLGRTLDAIDACGLGGERVGFHAAIDTLGASGFRAIRARLPRALLQCPVDFLAPLLVAAPGAARQVLAELRGWGIDRFSVDWSLPGARRTVVALDECGVEIDIGGVPDLESYLEAVLMLPASVSGGLDPTAGEHRTVSRLRASSR